MPGNALYLKMAENNPGKYPANMGKAWLDDEVVRLLKSVKDKKTHNEIATEHGRTLGGIVSRLKSIAADYYFDDLMSIDDIQQMTGLNKKKISNAIANRELQNYKKVVKAVSIKVAKANKSVEVYELLKDIQKTLKVFVEKKGYTSSPILVDLF